MIKFDKDVLGVVQKLEKEGYETYAIGECVRDTVAGIPTYDWDLVTKATIENLKTLYPEGSVTGEDNNTYRLDFVNAEGEGSIADVKSYDGDLNAVLAELDFTVNALADNPDKAFIDPFGGREDMKRRLVRTIEPARELFQKKPIKMLEAIAVAADMGYDLQKDVFDAILGNWRLLDNYDKDSIRALLERIITSENAGKGLSVMAESGLMAVIFGESVSRRMSSNEMRSFNTLCENIDKTKPVRLRRLGLLYTVLGKKKAFAALDRLGFSEKDRVFLNDAQEKMIDIQFLGEPYLLKRFIYEHGMERYDYVHNLSKAQRIVYDLSTQKIESRNFFMKGIVNNNEPIFEEDLAIDANDIMEAGITSDPEKAEKLLGYVTSDVHKEPRNNVRDHLLKRAKHYSRNPLSAKTRYVKWIR